MDISDVGATFTRREIVPHLQRWEDDGSLPRELHAAAAEQGLLGVGFAEDVGGQGGTLLDSTDLQEGMFAAGASSGLMAGLFTHGIALPHVVASGQVVRHRLRGSGGQQCVIPVDDCSVGTA